MKLSEFVNDMDMTVLENMKEIDKVKRKEKGGVDDEGL